MRRKAVSIDLAIVVDGGLNKTVDEAEPSAGDVLRKTKIEADFRDPSTSKFTVGVECILTRLARYVRGKAQPATRAFAVKVNIPFVHGGKSSLFYAGMLRSL